MACTARTALSEFHNDECKVSLAECELIISALEGIGVCNLHQKMHTEIKSPRDLL